MNPSGQTTLFLPHDSTVSAKSDSVVQGTSHSYDLGLTDTSDNTCDLGLTVVPASISMSAGFTAASDPDAVRLVSHIFNESFGFRPDGKPYRMGPKSVSERLMSTDYL